MPLKLIPLSGPRRGEEVNVTVPKFIIGRDRDCHLRSNSDVVSRHHCALIVEEDYVAVVDFSSKNGTYVNGARVVREQELHSGNLLSVGTLRFLVEVQLSVSSGSEGHPKRRSDQRDTDTPHPETTQKPHQAARPEEIVEDWVDASDPSAWLAQSDKEPSSRQPSEQGQELPGASRVQRAGEDVATKEEEPVKEDGVSDPAGLQREAGKQAAAAPETERAADTRVAAVDALRKIGKITPKKN